MIKCELCRGTGLVRVYNPWFITCLTRNRKQVEACGKRYKLWEYVSGNWRLNIGPDCEVPCKCSGGDGFLIWYRRSDGKLVAKLWNGRDEQQARFGECWWHVRVVTVNETQTESVSNEQHVAWIRERIANSVAPPNPKLSQSESEYLDGDDMENNQFAVALAMSDPFDE